MSRYKGEHRARSNRFKANRVTANREIVRYSTWQDVSDFLLEFDFSALIPKADYGERFRLDRVELMVNERARHMLYRKPGEIVKTTVS